MKKSRLARRFALIFKNAYVGIRVEELFRKKEISSASYYS